MDRKIFAAALTALVWLTGCRTAETETDPEIPSPGQEPAAEAPAASRPVRFTASSEALTRTAFGEKEGDTYPSFWTGNETVGISLNYGEQALAPVVPNEDRTVAEFSYLAPETEGGYTFFVVTPASALSAPSPSREALTVTVPPEQKPLAGSVDESAQVFWAKAGPMEERPASVEVMFNHLTAYGRLTLKNVPGTPASLTLVTDREWAGTCYVSPEDASVTVREGSHALSLDLANCTVSGGNLESVWFACLPVSLAGRPLTVQLELADGTTYRRTIAALGDAMVFTAGKVIHFSVNMASAAQVPAMADDVLRYDVYGAYIPGKPMLYEAATDQLSREYEADGTVTFSLLDPLQDGYVEFSGIPADAALLDTFTLGVRSLSRGETAFEDSFEVSVVKEEGAVLWLSDGTNGFIVKR